MGRERRAGGDPADGTMAAEPEGGVLGLRLDRHRILARPDARALHGPGAQRHGGQAALDHGRSRKPRRCRHQRRDDGLPLHQQRPGQHELVQHPAARAVPGPLREREQLREQPCRNPLPTHLGQPFAPAAGAGGPRGDVVLSRRPGQRCRQHQSLPRQGACDRPGLPARRVRREGRVRHHPGWRPRRPLRERPADDLVGLRRRTGEDRVPPRRGRDHDGDARGLQPHPAHGALGPRAVPAGDRAEAALPLPQHPSYEAGVGPGVHRRRRWPTQRRW